MVRDQEVEKRGGGRESKRERHVLPVAAAAGVRGTIKNDETRPSDGGNVEGVRRCLREHSFVPRAAVYH